MGDSGDSKETKIPSVPIGTGLAWPLANIVGLMGLPATPETKLAHPDAKPISDLGGHTGAMSSSIRSFTLAYLAIYYIHGGDDGLQYPAFGRAKEWDVEWMWPILLRNLMGTWLICGFWDWILYFSPLAQTFKPYKIIEDYPTLK